MIIVGGVTLVLLASLVGLWSVSTRLEMTQITLSGMQSELEQTRASLAERESELDDMAAELEESNSDLKQSKSDLKQSADKVAELEVRLGAQQANRDQGDMAASQQIADLQEALNQCRVILTGAQQSGQFLEDAYDNLREIALSILANPSNPTFVPGLEARTYRDQYANNPASAWRC